MGPKLNVGREAEIMGKLEEAALKAEQNVVIANEKNVKYGAENEVLIAQKNELMGALESSKCGASEFLEKEAKLMSQKAEVEAQLNEQIKRLENEEEAKTALAQ